MKIRSVLSFAAMFVGVFALTAQDAATVQTDPPGSFKPGGPVAFDIVLNEPLPKGARFDFRISPVAADEEVPLGSGQAVGDTQKKFHVSGNLPEGALPGEWHVSVIWLLLPGAGWTHNSISTNNLKFHVDGKPYPVPTKGEVSVAH